MDSLLGESGGVGVGLGGVVGVAVGVVAIGLLEETQEVVADEVLDDQSHDEEKHAEEDAIANGRAVEGEGRAVVRVEGEVAEAGGFLHVGSGGGGGQGEEDDQVFHHFGGWRMESGSC